MSGSKLSDDSAAPRVPDEPLGLTVHTLPSPGPAGEADSKRTRAGRIRMLFVLLVCAAPVIASYFMYYVVRPEARRNYGELIQPMRVLPDAPARDVAEDRELPLAALRGQWLLISVAPAACDADCERRLYLQRQLREALGKDKDRLEWVWLVSDDQPVRPALLAALKQGRVIRVPSAVLASWLAPAAGQRLEDHLYVVDPMGNWMLRFPAGLDLSGASRAKRDLERVLRASASWDTPGR